MGYNYQDVVAHAAGQAIFLGAVILLLLLVMASLVIAILAAVLLFLATLAGRPVAQLMRAVRVPRIAYGLLVVALPIALVLFRAGIDRSARDTANAYITAFEEPAEPPPVSFWTLFAALSAIRAEWGQGQWATPEDSRNQSVTRSFVLLLGSANGVTAVYDYCSNRVIRLPSESFVMTTVPTIRSLRQQSKPQPDAPETVPQYCDQEAAKRSSD